MPDNKTAHFAEARKLDAIIFLDGVEVPFTWFEVSFQMDGPSIATIAVEPDALTDLWRPKSWVHIFIRQTFPTDLRDDQVLAEDRDQAYDERTMKLYWEGELTSIKDLESAEQRATLLTAMDLWNVPMAAQLSMVSIGGDLSVPMVNGSTFFQGITDTNLDLVLNGLISYLFGAEEKEGKKLEPGKRGIGSATDLPKDPRTTSAFGKNAVFEKPNMGDLVRLLLEYLIPFNASYGLQALRTKLLDKMTSIADNSLGAFIKQAQVQQLMRLMSSSIGASSVMQLLVGMLQQLFHHTISIPCPAPVLQQSGERSKVTGYRSMAVVPNLYYSIPPLCNWLFPDQYQQRQVARDYMSEPTRLGLKTPLNEFIGEVIQLAPRTLRDRLFSRVSENTPTQQTFAAQGGASNVVRPADTDLKSRLRQIGFYKVDAEGNPITTDNLLMYMLPEELEKGILYIQDINDYQALLARAAVNANRDAQEPTADEKRRKLQSYGENVNKPGTHEYYMGLLAEYQLMFRKLSRGVMVAGPFNMWPVVGLPMFVVRQGRSYRGLLTGLTSRVDFSGQSQTSYQLDFSQLARPAMLSNKELQDIRQASDDIEAAATAANRLVEFGLLDKKPTAIEQYSTLETLDSQIFELINRVRTGPFYREIYALFEIESGTVTGSAASTTAALRQYLGVFAGITGSHPAPGVTAGIEDVVQGKVNEINLTEDEKASVLSQVKKNFDGRYSGGILSDYVDLILRLQDVVTLLYAGRGGNDVAQRILSGTSTDLGAYQDALVTTQPFINKQTRLIAQLEAELTELKANPTLAENVAEILSGLTSTSESGFGAETGGPDTVLSAEYSAAVAALEARISAERKALDAARKTRRDLSLVIQWTSTLDSWRVALGALTGPDTSRRPTSDELAALHSRLFVYRSSLDDPTVVTTEAASSYMSISDFRALMDNLQTLYRDYDRRRKPPELAAPRVQQSSISSVGISTLVSSIAGELRVLTELRATSEQIGAANDFRAAVTRMIDSVSSVTAALNQKALDIPPVFPFINQALTSITEVDDGLANLVVPLNAEGKYSSRPGGAQLELTKQFESQTKLNPNTQRDTIIKYDAFIRVARRIFPLADNDTGTEYQDHKVAGDPHEWANRVQARRAVCLGEFMQINKLALTKLMAESPFGKAPFYVLKQRPPSGPITGTERNAEDSESLGGFFSKFGVQLFERNKLGNSLEEIRVKVARNAEARTILGEDQRQELVIQYTKRHAGPATYQGKL